MKTCDLPDFIAVPQKSAPPRAPTTKKGKAKLSKSQIMSDITHHKAPLGILNWFKICPFRVFLDQFTQFVVPTKCTVLISYIYIYIYI